MTVVSSTRGVNSFVSPFSLVVPSTRGVNYFCGVLFEFLRMVPSTGLIYFVVLYDFLRTGNTIGPMDERGQLVFSGSGCGGGCEEERSSRVITIMASLLDLGTVTTATVGVLLMDKCEGGSGPRVGGGLCRLRPSGSCAFITGTEKEIYLRQLCPHFFNPRPLTPPLHRIST